MKLLLYLFFIIITLYAQEEQTCYTVQLVSVPNNPKNLQKLSSLQYDKSCKIMNIASKVTVRCGCYNTVRETKPLLKKLKPSFHSAYIMSTYKYRFEKKNSKEEKIINEIEKEVNATEQEKNITKDDEATTQEKREIKIDTPITKKETKTKKIKKKTIKKQSKNNQKRKQISSKKVQQSLIVPATQNNTENIENKLTQIQNDLRTVVSLIQIQNDLKTISQKVTAIQNNISNKTVTSQNTSQSQNLSSLEAKSSPTIQKKEKPSPKNEKIQQKIEEVPSLEEDNTQTLIEDTPKKEIKKKEKRKKKKRKKEKKKTKFVKKKPARYKYQRYLNRLKHDRAMGKWGYRYSFGAQLSYDLAYVYEEDDGYIDHDFRRARISHDGSFFNESLFYGLEYSFTGPNHYKDIYVGYKNSINLLGLDYRFKGGNIKIPFSLEGYTASKNNNFMERALTDGYTDRRKMGGEVLLGKELGNNRFNLFFNLFTDSIDERKDNDVDHPGYNTRAVYTYKADKYKVFSLGGAYMSQNYNQDSLKYNQASESDLIYQKYVSVKIKNVDTVIKKNIEAAFVYNKFSMQGEYTMVDVNALKDNYNFYGYYAQGSYFLLGNGRKYKTYNSVFGKVKPDQDGDLELAFRYSYINLNDKDEHGGSQTDYNIGLNWYLANEFKLMFNYVLAYPKDTDMYDGMLQIFQTRFLFAF